MRRSLAIRQMSVTLADLIDFVNEAQTAGVDPIETVRIHVDPTFNNPMDPGGEITIEVSWGR